jgi:hypothetical protein
MAGAVLPGGAGADDDDVVVRAHHFSLDLESAQYRPVQHQRSR